MKCRTLTSTELTTPNRNKYDFPHLTKPHLTSLCLTSPNPEYDFLTLPHPTLPHPTATELA